MVEEVEVVGVALHLQQVVHLLPLRLLLQWVEEHHLLHPHPLQVQEVSLPHPLSLELVLQEPLPLRRLVEEELWDVPWGFPRRKNTSWVNK